MNTFKAKISQLYHWIKNFSIENPGKFLFFLFLILACFTYQKYGVSWDEDMQKTTGYQSYNYIFEDDETLHEWVDKDYGVAFELPLVILEDVFKTRDARSIYLMRHFITHLLFLAAAYFLFKLIFKLTKSKWLSTLGFLFLVLHPAIYSHSFFNSKDIPFMSFLIINFYLIAKAFETKKLLHFIFLGIFTGLLISTRIMGILIPPIVLSLLLIDLFISKEYKKHIFILFIYAGVTVAFTIFSWPFLWEDPIENFMYAYENASKFRFNSATRFNGAFLATQETPWYFFPVWFLITNPILFLILFFSGSFALIFSFLKSPKKYIRNSLERNYLIYLAVFAGTTFMVIYKEAVIYDSWRQLYFLYPSVVLLMVFLLSKIKSTKLKKVSNGIILATFAFLIFHSIKQFPLQYVYFNQSINHFKSEHIRNQWEMEYWGTSFSLALEKILEMDNRHHIHVAFDHEGVGRNNLDRLRPTNRDRFIVRDRSESDYFITIYRWHPQDYVEYEGKEVYSFYYGNSKMYTIFKLK